MNVFFGFGDGFEDRTEGGLPVVEDFDRVVTGEKGFAVIQK